MNTSKQVNVMIGLMFLTFAVLGAYFLNESNRAEEAEEEITERIAERGARLFAQNCRTCHGVEGLGSGEGAIAPPLNSESFFIVDDLNKDRFAREFNTGGELEVTPAGEIAGLENFLFNTIACGRRGTFMPPWSQQFGGTLSTTQVNQLVTLITEGRWDLAEEAGLEADEESGVVEDALFNLSPYGPDPEDEEDEGDREAFDEEFEGMTPHEIQEELDISDEDFLDARRALVHETQPQNLSLVESNCGQYTAETAIDFRTRDSLVLVGGGGDGGGDDDGGTPTATSTPGSPVEVGRELAGVNGCTGCHTIDGNDTIGPTWLGLFGSTETLDDGSTVDVDEAYLIESIVDPNVAVVEGFAAGIMPQGYGDSLSDEQVNALVEYIKSLQ